MNNSIRQLLGFAGFVWRRVHEENCVQVAASLAYTTLLSLVPLLTIGLTVLSAFPVFHSLTGRVEDLLLANLVPSAAGKVISVYMQQFAEKAAGLTAIGIAVLAVTAIMLMLTIDHAFNRLWRVAKPRPLAQRMVLYWTAITLGPILIGLSLSVSSYLATISAGLIRQVPGAGSFILYVVPILLTMSACTLLYFTVPNRYVPLRHAAIGGAVAALGFEAMNRVFTAYITQIPTYTLVYGAFASLPIFLLWIYLSWLVVLVGAVITASLPYWRGGTWRIERTPGRIFYDALLILQELAQAQRRGEAPSLQALHQRVPVGLDEIEHVLERLSSANWVRRVPGDAWVLIRSARDLKVADVYRQFVLRPPDEMETGDSGIAELVSDMHLRLDEAMALPLADFFEASGGAGNGSRPTAAG